MADLHIGLAGAGHIAGAHLGAWRRLPGCRLQGVFDLDRAAAERCARAFGVARVYADLDELIEACDVVGVCTPPASHADLAQKVLAAGRNLLIEKPVVTALADWEQIAGQLPDSDGAIAVMHNLKFARGVLQASEWLRQGRIGRLLHLQRQFLTHPAGDRMLAGRHWSHALPGGRWFETLPHELYLIHHFAGPLAVRQVSALATARATAEAPADEVLVTFADDDRMATIRYSANCRLNRRQLALYGSEGTITVDILSDSASLSRGRDGRWRRATAGLAETAGHLAAWPIDRAGYLLDRLRRRSPHALLIERFAEHLRGHAESPTPLAEIDYVVRNADLIGREIDRQIATSP